MNSASLFSDSFLAGIGYGYRFHEFFQADIGFDTAFGAAGVRDFLPELRRQPSNPGLPAFSAVWRPRHSAARERAGAHLWRWRRSLHALQQNGSASRLSESGFRFDCDVCSSRHGIGYYGLVGVDVALDRAQHFRLGVGGRVIRGRNGRRSFRRGAGEADAGPLDQHLRPVYVQLLERSYLISLLAAVAGSAPQFSRMTSVWSE